MLFGSEQSFWLCQREVIKQDRSEYTTEILPPVANFEIRSTCCCCTDASRPSLPFDFLRVHEHGTPLIPPHFLHILCLIEEGRREREFFARRSKAPRSGSFSTTLILREFQSIVSSARLP